MTEPVPTLQGLRDSFNKMWAGLDAPTGKTCWACDGEIHVFGFRVEGVERRRKGPAAQLQRRFVCAPCYLGRQNDGRKDFVDGHELAGVEAQACEHCGFKVVLKPDARRFHHTCSEACRLALYRAEHRRFEEARGVELPTCDGCGAEMGGRADQRYCSGACRQRAYRRRSNGGHQ